MPSAFRRTAASLLVAAGASLAPFERGAQLPSASTAAPRFARTFVASSFQRGNIHTHSNVSDGDSDPADVYAWYRDHDYRFVVLTDHNTLVDPGRYLHLEQESFVLLSGEEVTMTGARRQVHVNGICLRQAIAGGDFATAGDALRWAVDQVRRQQGVALINHPNFDWGLTPADLPSARGAHLLEIASGHPYVRTEGGEGRPSHEALWDMALTGGLDVMGVAVDDTHFLGPADEPAARPGRAWVEVFSSSLRAESLCSSLERGDLYASTGPGFLKLEVSDSAYSVWPASGTGEVSFIGKAGKTLLRVSVDEGGGSVVYRLSGGEGYVRARFSTEQGTAWGPPVRVMER